MPTLLRLALAGGIIFVVVVLAIVFQHRPSGSLLEKSLPAVEDRMVNPGANVRSATPGSAHSTAPEREPLVDLVPHFRSLNECLELQDELQFLDCLYRHMPASGIPPEFLLKGLCADNSLTTHWRLLLAESIASWPTAQALSISAHLVEQCRRRDLAPLLADALADRLIASPAWATDLLATLSPELLFQQGTSDAILHVLHFLVWQHPEASHLLFDERVKRLVRDGALGIHGGTFSRIDRCILISAMFTDNEVDLVHLVKSVEASPWIDAAASRSGIGASLGSLLMSAPAGEGGLAQATVMALHELLLDPVFGPGAAVQICRYRGQNEPPPGFPAAEWSSLWHAAHAVVQAEGISFR